MHHKKWYETMSCRDEVWGDLTKKIKAAGRVADYSAPGVYTRTFSCTNPAPWSCTATAIVDVKVCDTTPPMRIALCSLRTILTLHYTHYALYSICIVFPLHCTLQVHDTTPPVCTTKKVLHLEASFPYTPTGIDCVDGLDGAVKATRRGSVDTEKPGTYIVTYTAEDKAGNVARFRQKVTVQDTLKPTIGLSFDGKWFKSVKAVDTAMHAGKRVKNPIGTADDPLLDSTRGLYDGTPYGVMIPVMEQSPTRASGVVLGAVALAVGAAALVVSVSRHTRRSALAIPV
jgi:hypothetical protein